MSRSSQHIEQGCLNLNICQIPKTAAAWRKRKHEPYLCRDRFIPWWVFQKLAANARIYVRRSRMQGGAVCCQSHISCRVAKHDGHGNLTLCWWPPRYSFSIVSPGLWYASFQELILLNLTFLYSDTLIGMQAAACIESAYNECIGGWTTDLGSR